ncbi:MAG: FAD-dependent monooxygenase [Proteobacteria bacterium]|nr:MAG: FAD-dependent monooxygenase [Pseudomonadota bacterium]
MPIFFQGQVDARLMNNNASLKVAIVGAGPGGLTLARVLKMKGIEAIVFERDLSPSFRPQGGTLDLHPDSGQLALYHAALSNQFQAIARYEDQGTRLFDHHGILHHEEVGSDGNRPEVDRTELRNLLLDSLDPDDICWNSTVSTIEALPDGRFKLVLTDGTRSSSEFDLVVGADGAWSKVRPVLSKVKPEYTGVTFYEIGIDDVDEQHPEIASLVGRGSMFALGKGQALIAQRNGHSHIRVYAALSIGEENITSKFDTASPDSARTSLAASFSEWSEAMVALILKGSTFRAWPLYALPIGHSWEHRKGLTLIGDAAHL